MKNFLIKTAVRTRFLLTTRASATACIQSALAQYIALAKSITSGQGARSVAVPLMPGVDEDMRHWSFYMILEHNVIVNQSMNSIVTHLARNKEPTGGRVKDPKKDVMPSSNPGPEQVEAFRSSVDDYLAAVSDLGPLRNTLTKRHPIFGSLDAHGWHCMFGFHLQLHYKQAVAVLANA